jgi:hypothetical protein
MQNASIDGFMDRIEDTKGNGDARQSAAATHPLCARAGALRLHRLLPSALLATQTAGLERMFCLVLVVL